MALKENKEKVFSGFRTGKKLFDEFHKEVPHGKQAEFTRQCIKDGLSKIKKLKATKEKKLKSTGVLE